MLIILHTLRRLGDLILQGSDVLLEGHASCLVRTRIIHLLKSLRVLPDHQASPSSQLLGVRQVQLLPSHTPVQTQLMPQRLRRLESGRATTMRVMRVMLVHSVVASPTVQGTPPAFLVYRAQTQC